MATTLFLYPTLDFQSHHPITPQLTHFPRSKFKSFFQSSPKPIKVPTFTSTSFTCSSTSHSSDFTTKNPQKFDSFLTNEELQKLQFLENYSYQCKLSCGYLYIRVMKDIELDMIVELLAVSFAESMFMPNMYLTLLGFLIKNYLVERRGLMPYCATLVGFLKKEENDEEEEFVGTVEVSFDKRGANASPPTPTPPKNCAYICNMTVKESFRRRGIGWHLLKASEELISNMSSSRNVYLHCRMIDSAPFSMYKKAGFAVVQTDSFLVLLTLQRRKHLMCKELPVLSKPLETVIPRDEGEAFPSMDERESEPSLSD